MYKVLLPQDIHDAGKNYLKDCGYDVVVGSAFDIETIKREIVDADAVIARTALYPAEVIEAGKRLKIIARHGVGTDNIDVRFAEKQGIWVTIARNTNVHSVAEHTILLLLACARNLVSEDKQIRDGGWEQARHEIKGLELRGKKLGVIGLGAIGLAVCEKAHFGLGMEILGYDILLDTGKLPSYVNVADTLAEVLEKSDAVTIHVPLNPQTSNLIDEKQLKMMKPSGILINCARGGIVNEEALYKILKAGGIRAAAMDVFVHEPINMNNKLLELNNFICTPHDAAMTDMALVEMALSTARACNDVLCGRRPEYPINNPIVNIEIIKNHEYEEAIG